MQTVREKELVVCEQLTKKEKAEIPQREKKSDCSLGNFAKG